MWSQHLSTMIAKWSSTLFRKHGWFSPFAEHSMITSACGWCLSKCCLLLTCCSNLDSSKRNGQSIDELICSDRHWKQTQWTQLLPFHWYSQKLICIRKRKFLSQSLYIYRLRTRTEDKCVLIIRHWIMRYIIKMNRWFSRYVIAAMLVDENKRFLISYFCSSTSNCTLQHCYLCPSRLVANHL